MSKALTKKVTPQSRSRTGIAKAPRPKSCRKSVAIASPSIPVLAESRAMMRATAPATSKIP
jgi:hypothetical protein